jgi:hypothetical protein
MTAPDDTTVTISSSKHPAWKLLDRAFPFAVIAFLLWFNYDSVDRRDLKTLIEYAMAMALRSSISPRDQ